LGARIKTLHVVGYKNSGKTTLVCRWIEFLKNKGLNVAVVKHHGHGAKLAMPDEGKDSIQYLLSGADASFVSGGGKTQHILNKELSYSQLKYLASIEKPDIILVEGYKREIGDKVVLLNNEQNWESFSRIEGVKLVVGDISKKPNGDHIISRENGTELDEWVWNWWQSND